MNILSFQSRACIQKKMWETAHTYTNNFYISEFFFEYSFHDFHPQFDPWICAEVCVYVCVMAIEGETGKKRVGVTV